MDGQAIDRFRKIAGMIGSAHDGECLAAARKATDLLRAAGHTWGDVGVNGAAAGQAKIDSLLGEVFAAKAEALMWKRHCEDERSRTKRLEATVDKLKRELAKLQARALGSASVDENGTLHDATTGEVIGKVKAPKMTKAERKEFYRAQWREQKAQEYAQQQQARQAQREANPNPRTVEPGDETLRAAIQEALETAPLRAHTREFLASVLSQESWTKAQREAVERTLRWVFPS